MSDTNGFNPEQTIEAVWAWDAETGDKLLLDVVTGKILMRVPKNNESSTEE